MYAYIARSSFLLRKGKKGLDLPLRLNHRGGLETGMFPVGCAYFERELQIVFHQTRIQGGIFMSVNML